ncbi:hypothetical protein T492DRAFT_839445 [Pavlovales sp. CCMP2436]|nr:hypothetical protein T492DRAFT_839445 [Pavlovales sp. CCMP2436]
MQISQLKHLPKNFYGRTYLAYNTADIVPLVKLASEKAARKMENKPKLDAKNSKALQKSEAAAAEAQAVAYAAAFAAGAASAAEPGGAPSASVEPKPKKAKVSKPKKLKAQEKTVMPQEEKQGEVPLQAKTLEDASNFESNRTSIEDAPSSSGRSPRVDGPLRRKLTRARTTHAFEL